MRYYNEVDYYKRDRTKAFRVKNYYRYYSFIIFFSAFYVIELTYWYALLL